MSLHQLHTGPFKSSSVADITGTYTAPSARIDDMTGPYTSTPVNYTGNGTSIYNPTPTSASTSTISPYSFTTTAAGGWKQAGVSWYWECSRCGEGPYLVDTVARCLNVHCQKAYDHRVDRTYPVVDVVETMHAEEA